jgi:hypothetical protein
MSDIKKYMDEIRNEQLKQTQNSLPTLAEMGKNLAQTVVDTVKSVVAGEGAISAETQADTRLKICESCEFYQNTRCTKCGCYMAVKTHLKAANCPVGKW